MVAKRPLLVPPRMIPSGMLLRALKPSGSRSHSPCNMRRNKHTVDEECALHHVGIHLMEFQRHISNLLPQLSNRIYPPILVFEWEWKGRDGDTTHLKLKNMILKTYIDDLIQQPVAPHDDDAVELRQVRRLPHVFLGVEAAVGHCHNQDKKKKLRSMRA
jgi:hypothetical protein